MTTLPRGSSYEEELCGLGQVDHDHSQMKPSSPADALGGGESPQAQASRPPQIALMVEALRENLPAEVCDKIQSAIDRVSPVPMHSPARARTHAHTPHGLFHTCDRY